MRRENRCGRHGPGAAGRGATRLPGIDRQGETAVSASLQALATDALRKATATLDLLRHSVSRYRPYDAKREYTPDELEPYDAMCDRFIRAVEMSVRLMRTIERLAFGDASVTFRDLLHRMEKLELVSSTGLWIDMRDVRNRVVHDYLPEQVAALYADIAGPYASELFSFGEKAASWLRGLEES
ncbi:MAG: hypothetical protein D6786_01210 [Gammaproteobacteria bacterium]|nr:MAG: hypothetical protein D6786_01210 [Gammaproteobacteria bacterium]